MIYFDCIVMYHPLVANVGTAPGTLNPLSALFLEHQFPPFCLQTSQAKIKSHKDA